MRMIDTHVHVWEAGSIQTAWMDKPPFRGDPSWDPLRASYPPSAFEKLMAAQDLDGGVLVEAADALEETDTLLELAHVHNWVVGVVGWLPLADISAFAAALERYADAPGLAGIRHQINTEPDPDWVLQAPVVTSLGRLGAAGLSFDYVGLTMDHLTRLPRLADACPDLTIVLDHLNNPPIAEGEFQPWADNLSEAAERPNVMAKISGLEMCSRRGAWTAADWRPYVDHALQVFGPERLMLGSNWPVSTLAGRFDETWAAHRNWLASLSKTEQAAISEETARRVYDRHPGI